MHGIRCFWFGMFPLTFSSLKPFAKHITKLYVARGKVILATVAKITFPLATYTPHHSAGPAKKISRDCHTGTYYVSYL